MLAGHCKLAPIPVARPWGGRALAERYGKPGLATGAPVGESWEACDVDGQHSRVASGPHTGKPVRELIGGPLPVLVKLLDAREPLSLQVHPDEDAARAIGGGAAPKTEAWHVLAAGPGAWVVLGLAPGTSVEALLSACGEGAPEPHLRTVPVSAGDTIFVPAGTVHAIGPGLLLYEVQQPSDTTYRLFDWGRVGLDGKPRALHISEALRSIKPDARPAPRRIARGTIAQSSAFRLVAIDATAPLDLAPEAVLRIITVIAGAGRVRSEAGEETMTAGETVLLAPHAHASLLPAPGGLRALVAMAGGGR